MDGRWDLGIGVWFESNISIYEEIEDLPLYHESYTIGGDYTFDFGNGIHLLCEHGYYRSEDSFLKKPAYNNNLSVLSLDYPLGIMDKLMFLTGYYYEEGLTYYYASYNLVYDYLSIYFNASLMQEKDIDDVNMPASGKSLQLLFQVNY